MTTISPSFGELQYVSGILEQMSRTDSDSWDLASSVGTTATMVAAARAVGSREDDPLFDDPYAAPLVRAVGLDFFTRLVDGEVELTDDDAAGRRGVHGARHCGADAVLRRLLHRCGRSGHPAGGDPGIGPGFPLLPAAVAGRHRRIRDRPAAGHRVQDHDDDVDRRVPRRRASDRRHRPPRGLAEGVARQRVRRQSTDGVERGGAAGLPAARGAGPPLRRHHGAERAGQPAGHRVPP